MAAGDRLSTLPDRALHRVLSFLDVQNAPRTSVLSRRWRTLWRQVDAVSLDTWSYGSHGYDGESVGSALFRDALAAVGAAGRCPVRKLSVLVESYYQLDYVSDVVGTSPGMDAVLAAPAVRGLEELSVVLRAEFGDKCPEYVLPTSRVPCQSLRVLELAGLTLGPPGAAVFARLETLKMVFIDSSLENLQAMLDAAPNLARLWLEWLQYVNIQLEEDVGDDDVMSKRRVLLRCPIATVSVTLMHCHVTDGLDLDAPSLRSLRYKGFLEHFPLSSTTPSGPPPNLQHVQLSFCTARWCGRGGSYPYRETPRHALFWEPVGTFSRLVVLKVKLQDINDLAVHSEQEQEVLLKGFPNLRFLQLKGSYEEDHYGTAVAIGNLLRCCPALQELRLKFKIHGDLYASPKGWVHRSEERQAQMDLEKSMASLQRLKSETVTSASTSSSVVDADDGDLSALKARSFPCLGAHLRKIRMEFKLESFNCFEVKLTKFLVENAVVLEEMEVHDGDQAVYEHVHHKLAMWRANSAKSKIKIVGQHNNGSSL
ncbi:hypothetical protein BAE44_0010644 [Dichanthelium oligosanthes]|uniref:F-box domain-containing protein n=1 Tax=Dichanthelium oligosanthes TaxID=888268 RepID=A0A1E5VT87_9POAL|nr:hypothetical protein BAE44_0010644 [Dichanthelium oligosanthes]